MKKFCRKKAGILMAAMLCLASCGAADKAENDFVQVAPVSLENSEKPQRAAGADEAAGAADSGAALNNAGTNTNTNTSTDYNGNGIANAGEPADAETDTLINPEGMTLAERIRTPEGYERTAAESGSFMEFLRDYPLKEDGSEILYYDGSKKTSRNHAAVFAMHLGNRDLQQCADSVMRIYAEYLRQNGEQDKIAFNFVSGFLFDYQTYLNGNKVKVEGNRVSWVSDAKKEDTDEVFEQYLNTVFNYASTISLKAEAEKMSIDEAQAGDIFIRAGSPGHVVMIVDVCENGATGKKAFLLAQGYMPAQEFHVLKNELHGDDPWYYEDEITYPFRTPEYVFTEDCLMRPGYLNSF